MQNQNANASDKVILSAYGKLLKVKVAFTGLGRTKQAFKEECDINQILARFKKTGVLDFQQKHQAQYGDCTAIDFQNAQLLIAEANGMFAAMPSALRSRFDNDPAKFLAFVNDKRNRNEAEDLGLLKVKPKGPEKAAEAAVPGPEVNPPAPAGVTPTSTTEKPS